MKVDIVIPYVDNKNKDWQEKYFTYFQDCKSTFFRTNKDFLKFLLRSIDTNLNWINNVFLVVQNFSEVPDYVDINKVKVITHDMFIPKEYLPTFNSSTIEMFLWNIPSLEEKFIYFNDDIFVMNYLSYEKFYVEDKAISHYYNRSIDDNSFWEIVFRGSKTVWGTKVKTVIDCGYVQYWQHTIRPYFKSLVKDCYFKHKSLIDRFITRKRELCNHNIYVFNEYIRFVGRNINEERVTLGKIINTDTKEEITTKFNGGYDTICLYEFTEKPNIFENETLINLFKTKFPNVCKYEKEK